MLSLKRATNGERPERLTLTDARPAHRRRPASGALGRRSPGKSLPRPAARQPVQPHRGQWFVLFQVAELAGGDWPERCRKAALADLARQEANDADGGRDADLLADVWEVFYRAEEGEAAHRRTLQRARAMDESPWRAANSGKAVDGYYLKQTPRRLLAGRRREDRAEEVA